MRFSTQSATHLLRITPSHPYPAVPSPAGFVGFGTWNLVDCVYPDIASTLFTTDRDVATDLENMEVLDLEPILIMIGAFVSVFIEQV